MNTERRAKTARLGELDKLVSAEFEVLLAPDYEPEEHIQPDTHDTQPREPDERVIYPHPFAEKKQRRAGLAPEPPSEDLMASPAAEVVGFDLQQRPAGDSLFSADEENFIASTSSWLRGRENADVVLDEIWRLVIGFESEEADEETSDDAADPLDQQEQIPEFEPPDAVADVIDAPPVPATPEPKTTGKSSRTTRRRRATPKNKGKKS